MTTKICKDCGIEKPLADFHKAKTARDGHLNNCRACCYIRLKKRRKKPKTNEYNKKYQAEYFQKNKEKIKAAREKHAEKIKARSILNSAVKSGKVVKEPCKVCGAEKVEGHHEDYSKPLEAEWLCRDHHAKLDAGRRLGSLPPEPLLE